MRGKRSRLGMDLRRRRLIPAHAGKTRRHKKDTRRARAHPRACGENLFKARCRAITVGSSPRMRGKLERYIPRSEWPRLIPAHAGKTLGRSHRAISAAAHPRACGENPPLHVACGGGGGSSPRMRGKRLIRVAGAHVGRLIPAHAGKTLNDLEF